MSNTSKISICGVISALAVATVMLAGVFPFATVALPAIAGLLLCVIVIEVGTKWAILSYITVAVLSLLIAPDREAAVLFACFFGFYPVLKGSLERINRNVVEWIIKIAVFTASIAIWYVATVFVFSSPIQLTENSIFGKSFYVILIFLLYVVFVLYDMSLTSMITFYIKKIRIKIFK